MGGSTIYLKTAFSDNHSLRLLEKRVAGDFFTTYLIKL